MRQKTTLALLLLLPTAGTGLPQDVTAPAQTVGEIVNPSAEVLDANNQPAHWTMDPRPRQNTTPGARLASDVAHVGMHSLMLAAGGASW
ncbi:MAG: hypothetical protein ACRD5F_11300, partial [Candidatus Acidiferrales bacterium]